MSARRLAVTFPEGFAADLAYVALRIGATKSDLLAHVAGPPIAALREVLFRFPEPLGELPPEEREELEAHLGRLLCQAVQQFSREMENLKVAL